MAVLWLSAALAAISLSLATTVRGEAERSGTAVDGLRTRYLAEGALRRGILHLDWARLHPEVPAFKPDGSLYRFDFPEGQAQVTVIPETAKLNINTSPPDDLFHVVLNLGVDPDRAHNIVAAILDWRAGPAEGTSPFDAFYASLSPPFHAPHVFFNEIEELLSVQGVTPDLYYGAWQPAPEGSSQRLIAREGLRDCFSVFGATDRFDVNTAAPAVLAAVGVPPEGVAAIVQRRRVAPFHTLGDLAPFSQVAGPGYGRLRVGGNTIFTLRSTARLRLVNGQLSDMRSGMGAMIKLMDPGFTPSHQILRWYDNVTQF